MFLQAIIYSRINCRVVAMDLRAHGRLQDTASFYFCTWLEDYGILCLSVHGSNELNLCHHLQVTLK